MSKPRRSPGRPTGSVDLRAAIVHAAEDEFAENGYAGATTRNIAAAAGVDPKLIRHYFGSKYGLFLEVTKLPLDPAINLESFTPDAGAARRGSGQLMDTLNNREGRRRLLGSIRAAIADPQAADIMRQQLEETAIRPTVMSLTAAGQSKRIAEIRASLLSATGIGLFLMLHVFKVEQLVDATDSEIEEQLAPILEFCMTGKIT